MREKILPWGAAVAMALGSYGCKTDLSEIEATIPNAPVETTAPGGDCGLSEISGMTTCISNEGDSRKVLFLDENNQVFYRIVQECGLSDMSINGESVRPGSSSSFFTRTETPICENNRIEPGEVRAANDLIRTPQLLASIRSVALYR
jgi:hypothetical protein